MAVNAIQLLRSLRYQTAKVHFVGSWFMEPIKQKQDDALALAVEAAITGEVTITDRPDTGNKKRPVSDISGGSPNDDMVERRSKRFRGWKKARKGIMTMLVSAHAGMATNPDKEEMVYATSLDDAAEDAEDDGQDS